MIRGWTNYIDILFFTWSVMGKQNSIVKFSVSGFFGCSGVPGCSGVFRSVPECFGVLVLRVFLVLEHAILLTIFDNAWQNPVKWLLRARQIWSTSDANMEHAGEESSTWIFRFRVAQACSLSFQIKFGNAWQNPVNWPLRDIEMKSTSAAIFLFRREQIERFSLYKQGTRLRKGKEKKRA